MTDEKWQTIRRVAMFFIGAFIILAELFTGSGNARPLVIALGLVLMGVVTFEQIVAWIGGRFDATERRPDGTPAMKPETPTKPERD